MARYREIQGDTLHLLEARGHGHRRLRVRPTSGRLVTRFDVLGARHLVRGGAGEVQGRYRGDVASVSSALATWSKVA